MGNYFKRLSGVVVILAIPAGWIALAASQGLSYAVGIVSVGLVVLVALAALQALILLDVKENLELLTRRQRKRDETERHAERDYRTAIDQTREREFRQRARNMAEIRRGKRRRLVRTLTRYAWIPIVAAAGVAVAVLTYLLVA